MQHAREAPWPATASAGTPLGTRPTGGQPTLEESQAAAGRKGNSPDLEAKDLGSLYCYKHRGQVPRSRLALSHLIGEGGAWCLGLRAMVATR